MVLESENKKMENPSDASDGDDKYREVRAQLQALIKDPAGTLGLDDNDCFWMSKIRDDGSQIWASLYKQTVRSAGSNPPSMISSIGLKLLKPGSKLHEQYIHALKNPYAESVMKSVIPRHITLSSAPYLLFLVIHNFLLNYNCDLQSEAINLLMEELEYGHKIPEVHDLLCEMASHIPIRYDSASAVALHRFLGVKTFLRFDTYDFYMATICFLEKYGKQREAPDVLIVGSELGQFHIAQWVYKTWENCMVYVLNKVGSLEDDTMHEIKKWHDV